ncbi:hypothetical protein E5288_WYG019707 [Bos mutus]|uniref:Uncharacterized protein n=1 Tax=Bos mutus TaxID=72004 RepID=A0A6B0S6X1_9CETA|nr:hypothetical protein [Bos mutus]
MLLTMRPLPATAAVVQLLSPARSERYRAPGVPPPPARGSREKRSKARGAPSSRSRALPRVQGQHFRQNETLALLFAVASVIYRRPSQMGFGIAAKSPISVLLRERTYTTGGAEGVRHSDVTHIKLFSEDSSFHTDDSNSPDERNRKNTFPSVLAMGSSCLAREVTPHVPTLGQPASYE